MTPVIETLRAARALDLAGSVRELRLLFEAADEMLVIIRGVQLGLTPCDAEDLNFVAATAEPSKSEEVG